MTYYMYLVSDLTISSMLNIVTRSLDAFTKTIPFDRNSHQAQMY